MARRTFSRSPSNSNSGVCTPTTASPFAAYLSAHARTYGSERSQLMHVYVPKLTRTTRPRSAAAVSGTAFNQAVAPSKPGSSPSTGYSLRCRSMDGPPVTPAGSSVWLVPLPASPCQPTMAPVEHPGLVPCPGRYQGAVRTIYHRCEPFGEHRLHVGLKELGDPHLGADAAA